jgi:hypothetical protein
MLTKVFLTTVFILVSSTPLLAQTSFKGILPGSTTRSQVEHAFGLAVKEVSATLSEYEATDVAGKIYVQFRSGADVVERVEVIYQEPIDRSKVAVSLKLPSRPTASQVNSKGKREEYYAAACIVLTFAGENVEEGVSRVGYYSRKLFDGAVPEVSKTSSLGDSGRASDSAPPRTTEVSPKGSETSSDSDPGLLALTGTFEFSAPEMAEQKSIIVEIVDGKLRWRSGAVTDTLIATGNGSEKDADGNVTSLIYMFKFASKPGIKLQFFVRGGRTRQVVYLDSTDGKMGGASFGFPKRSN